MADHRNNAGLRDASRINLSERYDLRYWTSALGVDETRLRRAVQAVGDRADGVRAYLSGR